MLVRNVDSQSAIDGYVALLNSTIGGLGVLQMWDGSPPANCGAADAGTMIVESALSGTPIDAAVANVAAFGAIANGTAVANGTVQYWRIKNNGGTCVLQGSVGTGAEEIVLDNATFVIGDTLVMDSFSLTFSINAP